jgi:sugar O-acyltransferase (sialic acid O-acetyltransferase NeuD family)
MPTAITIPLLNPNEPEAVVAALHVSEGQQVSKGDLICSLESTKSTFDLEAETSGYIKGLRLSQGMNAQAGELLGYISDDPEWTPPESVETRTDLNGEPIDLPAGLRITKPALALARGWQVDLTGLPTGRLITETLLKDHLSKSGLLPSSPTTPGSSYDPTKILIYGGGGHGKMVIDLLETIGSYNIAGIIDDGIRPGDTIAGVQVLGNRDRLADLYKEGTRLAVNAVGGIGNINVRIMIFERLAEAGFGCPALVHPTAYVEKSAKLEAGTQVFVHAYIGSEARLGYGCIANTGAIISHDCFLDDYVVISPGAILAGEVQVGRGALIGMGVTVNLGVKIGTGARVGNSATVKADVPEGAVVRAGAIWPA